MNEEIYKSILKIYKKSEKMKQDEISELIEREFEKRNINIEEYDESAGYDILCDEIVNELSRLATVAKITGYEEKHNDFLQTHDELLRNIGNIKKI